MLNRKATPPNGAGRNRRRDVRRGAGTKSSPERRRFVISSHSRREISRSPQGNGKSRTHTATSIAEAEKRLPGAPETRLLPPVFRAVAQAMLGEALLRQGNAEEAVPLLDDAVRHIRNSPSDNLGTWVPTFYRFGLNYKCRAVECLASALEETGKQERIAELLNWAFERRDAQVRSGGLLESRVQLTQCAWQLARALNPNDPRQAARRREVLARALELLDDPETAPRLTPEEKELRADVDAALLGSSPETQGRKTLETSGT